MVWIIYEKPKTKRATSDNGGSKESEGGKRFRRASANVSLSGFTSNPSFKTESFKSEQQLFKTINPIKAENETVGLI